ncbi:cytidylyltransferase [Xylariaceae sp. FL0255]|nr:cytidylyltransferase [Xylariaceae sp. FL0255]
MENPHPSLLLLPSPPRPATHAAVRAAFEPPLKATMTNLKEHANSSENGIVLIVAVVSPILISSPSPSSSETSLSWVDAQSVLAGIYSIVAIICSRLSIPSEAHAGPGSIDVRVVFVHHEDPSPSCRSATSSNSTIVVDLSTFASTYHPWTRIFHPNNEQGYQVLTSYLQISETVQSLKHHQITVVEGGLSLTVDSTATPSQASTYPVVCLGGTFDHLHPGHKLLLTAAALLLRVPEKEGALPARFIIGITGDELLKRKKYAEFVQSWDERVGNVVEFLSSVLQLSKSGWEVPEITKRNNESVAQMRGGTIEIRCVVLQDPFGPTITEEDMDVLVFSAETRSGGNAVNERRRDLGWRLLETFEVDVLDAEHPSDGPTKTTDFASKISSTAIRQRKAESLT